METPTPNPSRFKKILRRAVFALAALVTLLALFIAEEHWRGNRAWHNYKIAMEAKGERFDAARLIPPKVPDDENFAACPYLAHFFADSPGTTSWTNVESYLPEPFTGRQSAWPYGLASDLTNWAEAFLEGISMGETEKRSRSTRMRMREHPYGLRGQSNSPPGGLPMKTAGTASLAANPPAIEDPVQAAAIVLDHLKVCEPVLNELRSASLRRYSRFNIPYENLYEDFFVATNMQASRYSEHLAGLKGLYRVLSLHADAEMVAGKTEQSLMDVQVMFRLDDSLGEEPILISQLVRMAGVEYILQSIAQGLCEHRYSEDQIRNLEKRLGQIDLPASTVQSFYGERDLFANWFQLGRVIAWLGWDKMEQVNYYKAFDKALLPRINLAEQQVNPSVGRACDLVMSNCPGPANPIKEFTHHDIFAAMTLPSLFHIPSKVALAQTDVDLVRVACALERYRLAERTYPEKLEDLTPHFIAKLPHDIINGQPLKYRRAANGKFVLYSVGWNMKDDGGVTVTNKSGSPNRLQGDWVLEYPN